MYSLRFTLLILILVSPTAIYALLCGVEQNDLNHCHKDMDATECEQYFEEQYVSYDAQIASGIDAAEAVDFYTESLGTGGDGLPYGCIKVSLEKNGNPPVPHILFNENSVADSSNNVCGSFSYPCICKCQCQEVIDYQAANPSMVELNFQPK